MTDKIQKMTNEELQQLYNSLPQEDKDQLNKLDKLMQDSVFRNKVIENPRIALIAEGITLYESAKNPDLFYQNIKLSATATQPSKITDDDLSKVVGGGSNIDDAISWKVIRHCGDLFMSGNNANISLFEGIIQKNESPDIHCQNLELPKANSK